MVVRWEDFPADLQSLLILKVQSNATRAVFSADGILNRDIAAKIAFAVVEAFCDPQPQPVGTKLTEFLASTAAPRPINEQFRNVAAAPKRPDLACPKCGGIRQIPLPCVIGLDDRECPAKSVDVAGVGEFFDEVKRVGGTPRIGVSVPMRQHSARGLKPEPTPITEVPPGVFVVEIRASNLRSAGGSYFIPAHEICIMYRDAVIAEMHPTVKKAVQVFGQPTYSLPEARIGSPSRANVTVRCKNSGELTNEGASFLFRLRDAANYVINHFVPPADAWRSDVEETPRQGEKQMSSPSPIDVAATVVDFVDNFLPTIDTVVLGLDPAAAPALAIANPLLSAVTHELDIAAKAVDSGVGVEALIAALIQGIQGTGAQAAATASSGTTNT